MRNFIERLAGPLDHKTRRRPKDRRGQHRDQGCGQHPGLLLQRYLAENATGDGGNPEEKRAILQAAINAAGNEEVRTLYRGAFDRWSATLPTQSTPVDLRTEGRLIVGLGSENVLETGIRLHHTYGMPILPGSALKGLGAHYCDQVWGTSDKRFTKPTPADDGAYREYLAGKGPKPDENFHRLLFGTTDDNGCIVFHDAWLIPDSENQPLKLDVMTPHHPNWLNGSVAPTDFDSPKPVPFLSVAGEFRLAVSWHGAMSDQSNRWTDLARSLLCAALRDWGIGGKTTSGYGRLAVPPPPPPSAPPKKRDSGEKAKVKIIAARPKGGFEVQDIEPGRPQGTLTLGTPPPGTETAAGTAVDVLVHVDDQRKPQYKWPPTAKK